MRISGLQNSAYHGTGGYLTIEELRYQSKITENLLNASQELGYQIIDINGEIQHGFTRTHGTLRNGLRCSTAKGFLRPAKRRKNLHISLYSHAHRLVINNRTKVVEGVQFQKYQGKVTTVRVRKEVIVSAGTVKSPQVMNFAGSCQKIFYIFHLSRNFYFFQILTFFKVAHFSKFWQNFLRFIAIFSQFLKNLSEKFQK